MPFYRVYDMNHAARTFTLCDDAGRYHLAGVSAELPSIGLELEGESAAMGCRILVAPTGQVFRAIFHQVDCGSQPTC